MKAIIMAGGEGSRLRPLTCDLPKPMVPVMNRPVMEYSIELLKKYGIMNIGVTLQYLPDKIKEYFEDGNQWGVHLKYFVEETPLGTAGSVKNADDFLDETFIVVSGDALTDIDLGKAIDFHKKRGSVATLVTKKVSIPLEYGVIITDKNKRITQFLEKPGWGEVFSDTVNTGIYILEPQVLEYFEKGKPFDFSKDLFPLLLKDKKPMYGYVTDEYWCDIGDLHQYLQAHYDVLDGKVRIDIRAHEVRKGIWIEDGTDWNEGHISISSPCYIGSNCEFSDGAVVDAYSILGDNCKIGERSSLKRCVLWDQVMVKKDVELRGAVICDRVQIHNKSSIFEEAVVGKNTVVGDESVIKPNIKIWPDKMIEPASTVAQHIIWGTRQTKTLFGEKGICGTINVDLTPEFTTCVAASFGATLKENSRIAIGCEKENSTMMLKDAVKSGLLSEGVDVYDMGYLSTSMMRYGIRYFGLQGGIHIRMAQNDSEQGIIEIFDANGADIERNLERKIENLFARQDFKRASAGKIARCHSINDISIFYMRNLINSVNKEIIHINNPKVILLGEESAILYEFSSVLRELGCEVTITIKNTNEGKSNLQEDRQDVEELSQLAADDQAAIGIVIEKNGEDIILFDGRGNVIKDDKLVVLISLILLRTHHQPKLVIPLHAPEIIEKMAQSYNGSVERTKTSRQCIMEKLLNCTPEELQYRLEMFNLYFDGLSMAVKVIEFLAREGITFTQLLKDMPEYHTKYKTVACPWTDKGKVIRNLIENENDENIELLEGVKVKFDKGWALVLPDADAPMCKVYSEGYSEEYAESLTDMYIDKIEKIRKS